MNDIDTIAQEQEATIDNLTEELAVAKFENEELRWALLDVVHVANICNRWLTDFIEDEDDLVDPVNVAECVRSLLERLKVSLTEKM